MTLSAGTRLGPYEILSPLGAGGMGEVYRAKDPRLGRDVAVKVLPATFSSDPDRLKRFEQEARAAGVLNHPNVTIVYDIGTHDGAPYVVQELLEGETLRSELAGGRFSPRKAIDYAVQVAQGLAAAHEKGIVHRDLKPENLFVTKEGRVKILDFGLAKLTQPEGSGTSDTNLPTETRGTEPGVVMGTLGYMSPEQVKGKAADARSDIFALGSILYEMLSGKRAFQGESAAETISAILREDPPDLSVTNQSISPGLERIVRHCLEKSPERRFQSAGDIAFDLEAISTVTQASGAVGAMAARAVWRRRLALGLVIALALALGVWAERQLALRGDAHPLTFRRLTFRRGNLLSARFAPDGQTVVYGAAWEGRPSELFSVRTDSIESRPLGIERANVFSVSSKGELAVVLGRGGYFYRRSGTLARVALGGGAARDLQADVLSARWAPDGETLAAVSRAPSGKLRLEYPLGHVLRESFLLSDNIALSPAGDVLAFVEYSTDNKGAIWVVDRSGKRRQLTKGWSMDNSSTIAWSRSSGEIFFIGGETPGDRALRAVSTSGRERVVWPGAEGYALHDVAADGRILLERGSVRYGVIWVGPGESLDKDLGWLDHTALRDLSADGSEILFAETGEAAGPNGGAYLRKTDGSPAVRLGDGDPWSLSPDGKWVLTLTQSATPEIALLPTGVGAPRKVPIEGIKPLYARFIGDGRRIAIYHSEPGEPPLLSVVGLDGGHPKPVATPGVSGFFLDAFSPDGALYAYATADGKIRIVPVDGGAPRSLPGPGLEAPEFFSSWSSDGRHLLVQTRREIPARVFRIDVQTGERALWKEIQPSDRVGYIGISSAALFTQNGAGYAYTAMRVTSSDLYLVEGLK